MSGSRNGGDDAILVVSPVVDYARSALTFERCRRWSGPASAAGAGPLALPTPLDIKVQLPAWSGVGPGKRPAWRRPFSWPRQSHEPGQSSWRGPVFSIAAMDH